MQQQLREGEGPDRGHTATRSQQWDEKPGLDLPVHHSSIQGLEPKPGVRVGETAGRRQPPFLCSVAPDAKIAGRLPEGCQSATETLVAVLPLPTCSGPVGLEKNMWKGASLPNSALVSEESGILPQLGPLPTWQGQARPRFSRGGCLLWVINKASVTSLLCRSPF